MQLGHKKPEVTLNVYTHLWPEALDETADYLDAARARALAPAEAVEEA